MSKCQFKTPVRLLVGLGYPITIGNALEALKFLQEQPGEGREKTAALAACRATIEGRTVASTAHFALSAYAAKRNMLLEDPAGKTPALSHERASLPKQPSWTDSSAGGAISGL